MPYLRDGQNLFDPALSYAGIDWDVDGAMTRLVAQGRAREAIAGGVWNTPLRFAGYMPRNPLEDATPAQLATVGGATAADARSDACLRFLVNELKPLVDATCRTRPGRDDTFVMGSSTGGPISLYAIAGYPQVFAGAGAVSAHRAAGDGATIDGRARALTRADVHRLCFDHGTATLDAPYAPHRARMDTALPGLGYRIGGEVRSLVLDGAAHDEAAWRSRVGVPLPSPLAPAQ